MAGLGYGVPAGLGVGRPKTEYIESVPLVAAVYDGPPEDNIRRGRRSAVLHATKGQTSYGLVFGSNATLHGPIHFDASRETRCHELVKIWDKKVGDEMGTSANPAAPKEDDLNVILDFLENEPDAFETMMCLGMSQAPAATCVTHPHFRYAPARPIKYARMTRGIPTQKLTPKTPGTT